MATLRRMRPDEKTNQLAEMTVFLNNTPLGTLRNNETKVFVIPAGKHRLKAQINSQGSKAYQFVLTDGDDKQLVIATNNEANAPAPLVSGTLLDFLVVPLQLLYYFVIGHKRYLSISELKMK